MLFLLAPARTVQSSSANFWSGMTSILATTRKQALSEMIKAGIIDPTKVVRLAVQGAAFMAVLLITTEAMVAEKP